MRNLAKGGVA